MTIRREECWASDEPERYGPCAGEVRASEDYPGIFVFFCERHGHPEDWDATRRATRDSGDIR